MQSAVTKMAAVEILENVAAYLLTQTVAFNIIALTATSKLAGVQVNY